VAAEVRRGAESGCLADLLNGQAAGLEELTGALDPLRGQPFQWRGPGDSAELPYQGSFAEVRVPGDGGYGQRFVQVLADPVQYGREPGVVRARGRGHDVLGLPAITVGWCDELAGQHVRHRGPMIAAHHVQAQVDA